MTKLYDESGNEVDVSTLIIDVIKKLDIRVKVKQSYETKDITVNVGLYLEETLITEHEDDTY